MSLFPAYAGTSAEQQSEASDSQNWLQNSTFTVDLPNDGISSSNKRIDDHESDTSDVTSINGGEACITELPAKRKKKKHDHKKKSREKEKRHRAFEIGDKEEFFIDAKRDATLLDTKKLPKSLRPRYECPCKSFGSVATAKYKATRSKAKIKRYFSKKYVASSQDDTAVGEELSKQVQELNRSVFEDETNAESWIRLADFQDEYFKFQPIRYKTAEERVRAANLQKMTILERGLKAISNNTTLQKKWLTLAIENCTFDEVESKLKSMSKNQDSLVLTLGRIMLLQQSMPKSTSPAVIDSYKEAIENIQRLRHLPSAVQDSYTLEILLHACVYLQQSGLTETMWKILQLTLSLNMSFDLPVQENPDQVVLEQEDKILQGSSGVPIWILWTRMERLRQGYHFLPVLGSENFPQRVVSSDEVVEFVHHFRQSTHLHLFVLLLFSAGVPLLPRRHAVFSALSSQLTPWLLDNVEQQLAAVYLISPVLQVNMDFFTQLLPDSVPPQYLKKAPGQKQYLDFIMKTFEATLNYVEGRQRVALGVWYLRFLRWLDKLSKLGRYEPCLGFPKTKSLFKDVLKQEKNRDVITYYVEYALWDFESGNSSGSVKTLETLAASHGPTLEQTDESKKTDLCRLYRTWCEVLIASKKENEAKVALGKLCKSTSDEMTEKKLKHVTIEITKDFVGCDRLEHMMLPQFSIDWIACFVWFLALTGRSLEAERFLDEIIKSSSSPALQEQIYEIWLLLLKTFPGRRQHPELDVLKAALRLFPANTTFSVLMADTLIQCGGLWWKDASQLLHPPITAGAVLLVCATRERQMKHDSQDLRFKGMLKQLVTGDAKSCAILQRMQLKVLLDGKDLNGLENARVLALEACPWNKSLYMAIVDALPAQLMPLTDLMTEKNLRLHITPDEVDAMRD